jgi:hypothetical protein
MADKAVSALTQVTNHAAIGNCFMVAQKGAGAGSTNSSLISALQVNYSRVANSYPFGNGDGNAYGVRTLATSAPALQTINDMWYDTTASSWTASNSTVYVINQSTNAFIKAASVYVKQAGAWTPVKEAWIKNAGAWVKFLFVSPVITITGGYNINLRSFYQTQTGDYSSTPVSVNFNVTGNIGSTSTSTPALDTGTWPTGSNVTLTNNAIIAGAGGAGGAAVSYPYTTSRAYAENGFTGGTAISLGFSMTLNNLGTIGGGGGGGGGMMYTYLYSGGFTTSNYAGGGGGAGISAGSAGVCNAPGNLNNNCRGGSVGSSTAGGAGGVFTLNSRTAYGGTGGNLGVTGTNGTPPGPNSTVRSTPGVGGAAGQAIALNGYVATRTGNVPLGTVS